MQVFATPRILRLMNLIVSSEKWWCALIFTVNCRSTSCFWSVNDSSPRADACELAQVFILWRHFVLLRLARALDSWFYLHLRPFFFGCEHDPSAKIKSWQLNIFTNHKNSQCFFFYDIKQKSSKILTFEKMRPKDMALKMLMKSIIKTVNGSFPVDWLIWLINYCL